MQLKNMGRFWKNGEGGRLDIRTHVNLKARAQSPRRSRGGGPGKRGGGQQRTPTDTTGCSETTPGPGTQTRDTTAERLPTAGTFETRRRATRKGEGGRKLPPAAAGETQGGTAASRRSDSGGPGDPERGETAAEVWAAGARQNRGRARDGGGERRRGGKPPGFREAKGRGSPGGRGGGRGHRQRCTRAEERPAIRTGAPAGRTRPMGRGGEKAEALNDVAAAAAGGRAAGTRPRCWWGVVQRGRARERKGDPGSTASTGGGGDARKRRGSEKGRRHRHRG